MSVDNELDKYASSFLYMSKWQNYFIINKNRNPRAQLVRAVSCCKKRKDALDLGAGTLVESKFLIKRGFNVIAVDDDPEAAVLAQKIKSNKLTFKNQSFRTLRLGNKKFDLINAEFSLPFHGNSGFNSFARKVIKSLRPGGIFTGQFFGVKDSWNSPQSNIAFHSKKQVLRLLSGLELIELTEKEKDEKTASGHLKHWHTFNFIARKR
jgi:SAM-dependent methyltransferase